MKSRLEVEVHTYSFLALLHGFQRERDSALVWMTKITFLHGFERVGVIVQIFVETISVIVVDVAALWFTAIVFLGVESPTGHDRRSKIQGIRSCDCDGAAFAIQLPQARYVLTRSELRPIEILVGVYREARVVVVLGSPNVPQ